MGRLDKLLKNYAPLFVQDLAISLYNTWLYSRRHGGGYSSWMAYYSRASDLGLDEVTAEAAIRRDAFLEYVTSHSEWYRGCKGAKLEDFPVLEKSDLVANLDRIATVGPKQGIVSLTGGTTGASMKVYYTRADLEE